MKSFSYMVEACPPGALKVNMTRRVYNMRKLKSLNETSSWSLITMTHATQAHDNAAEYEKVNLNQVSR